MSADEGTRPHDREQCSQYVVADRRMHLTACGSLTHDKERRRSHAASDAGRQAARAVLLKPAASRRGVCSRRRHFAHAARPGGAG